MLKCPSLILVPSITCCLSVRGCSGWPLSLMFFRWIGCIYHSCFCQLLGVLRYTILRYFRVILCLLCPQWSGHLWFIVWFCHFRISFDKFDISIASGSFNWLGFVAHRGSILGDDQFIKVSECLDILSTKKQIPTVPCRSTATILFEWMKYFATTVRQMAYYRIKSYSAPGRGTWSSPRRRSTVRRSDRRRRGSRWRALRSCGGVGHRWWTRSAPRSLGPDWRLRNW